MWDVILTSNLSIIDNSKIPLSEYKSIINSLNLKLNLQEKQVLIDLADPLNQGKCDINLLLAKIDGENGNISDRARFLILEKFSNCLFANDLSFTKAFIQFDSD